jgi:hypothetical protein
MSDCVSIKLKSGVIKKFYSDDLPNGAYALEVDHGVAIVKYQGKMTEYGYPEYIVFMCKEWEYAVYECE